MMVDKDKKSYVEEFPILFSRFMVTQVSGEVEVVEDNRVLRAFKAVDLVVERRMVTLEWVASPVNGKIYKLT